MMPAADTGPCVCWYGPAHLHDGHCCFRDASICHPAPEDMRAAADEESAS